MSEENRQDSALLLGVGFDHHDDHRRITRGDHFYLVGGSEVSRN